MRAALPAGCLCAASLFLVACGGASEPSARASTPAREPASTVEYRVHEWGLIRAGEGDRLEVGAMGPVVEVPLMVVEKPVLYFHLADGGPLALSSVRVEVRGGEIVEHWPVTTPGASTTVEWRDLSLARPSCPIRPPTPTEPPCDRAPGICEAAALARAATLDGACVRGEGFASPLLFYRSTSRTFTVPLVVTRQDDGAIAVEHQGTLPIPGRLVRFRRDGDAVTVTVAAPPALGELVTLAAPHEPPAEARIAVTATLLEVGLSEQEARAFLTSWDHAFFGGAPTQEVVEEDQPPIEEALPPEETLLYFLPEPDVDGVATLRFDPPPVEVRRAMAVWTRF